MGKRLLWLAVLAFPGLVMAELMLEETSEQKELRLMLPALAMLENTAKETREERQYRLRLMEKIKPYLSKDGVVVGIFRMADREVALKRFASRETVEETLVAATEYRQENIVLLDVLKTLKGELPPTILVQKIGFIRREGRGSFSFDPPRDSTYLLVLRMPAKKLIPGEMPTRSHAYQVIPFEGVYRIDGPIDLY